MTANGWRLLNSDEGAVQDTPGPVEAWAREVARRAFYPSRSSGAAWSIWCSRCCPDSTVYPHNPRMIYFRLARIVSISSMIRFICLIVRSSGSSLVMSTPASFSNSIGYFEPPADRNLR